ncbi:hypothetical protein [Virgibacillus salexigens]|uniref:Uncharacterized protein n=1 Tax=Virgibacillus massiliensis TaxID=1462526 RepID=A0A024QHU3_9BACI|nr:hypothetical protein [Virgibacillus massiliensis]CDQ42118.1 hypothetical protein BN990_04498 [Virgibacillus massiliensis]
MYIEKTKSKGVYYLYLRKYDGRIRYGTKKRTLYAFGRLEKARNNLIEWKNDISKLPEDLKKHGCTRDDLEKWISQTHSKPAGFQNNPLVHM